MISLKNVLLVNALSSALTALALIAFAPFAAQLFGITEPLAFRETGIFLLLFALLVFNESRQSTHRSKNVLFIITLDVLWVTGSAAIVLFRLFDLSFAGYLLISLVGIWVAAMAFLQAKNLKG